MDKILHDLGGIVLNGLPTFFLVLILAACVKYLYLNPLEKVLAEHAAFDLCGQIAMGRGDDANVDPDGLGPAHALEFSLL